jgi:2-polyprenyl-6-methoxyphenol hydroxylase-like FAD-dependent oxidoreductase
MINADVIVVGAGPTGLMLAGELCLAGVRTVVLERQPQIREIAKAGGLSGQIIDLLRCRGILERFEAATTEPIPALRLPFGGLHVDFTQLAAPPMELLPLPQPQLERVLETCARERGAEIRRGHDVIAIGQDDTAVTADVRGPDGPYRVTARFLAGCDGAYGRVRDMAGIAFPGVTYPEVNRLAQFSMPDSVTACENGDIEVAGIGRIAFGFTPTERGLFAQGSAKHGLLGLFTSEDETTDYNDDEPMTVAEMRESIRRVLGVDLPLGEPLRLTRFTFHARHVEQYRAGRVLLAGDAAHLFPAPGVALNAGMIDSVNLAWKLAADINGWAPASLLDTYHEERHIAAERTLLHTRAQLALRRGHDPAAEALRQLFTELLADEQPLKRIGAFIAGSDIRYPSNGAHHHALTGTFARDVSLPSARPLFIDLAGREELRTAARAWEHRIDIQVAPAEQRPADALLIRPDAYIAWAAGNDEPTETAVPALLNALHGWFGAP